MAKHKARRPQGPSRPRQDQHAQELLDAVMRPTQHGELDIAPLLVAFRLGVLDDHLEQIAVIINDRIRALNAIDELRAASRLHVGDHVHLGHNLKPQYLHGKGARIIAKDGEKWIVRLDKPIGRFTDADLRLSAIQLEPCSGPE